MKKRKKEIVAGYSYPGHWNGKGSPIYPEWWTKKPSAGAPDYEKTWYEEYQEEMAKATPEEIILKKGEYTLVIDYPLSTPFEKEFKVSKKGMTRQEFVDMACESYQLIYAIEEASEGKTGNIPGMLNRTSSSGKYGIWGHHIGDLTIHILYVGENNVITLGVDS